MKSNEQRQRLHKPPVVKRVKFAIDSRPFAQIKTETFFLYYSVESLASGSMEEEVEEEEEEEMGKNSSCNVLFLEGGVAL